MMAYYLKRTKDGLIVTVADIVKEIEADTRLVYDDRLVSILWAELEGESEGAWFATYALKKDAEDAREQYYRKILTCDMEL